MTQLSSFICPVCRGRLTSDGKCLFCEKGHSYDISKSGYVNLLMTATKGRHGDDKLMVKSRTGFLNKGYYDKLKDEVTRILKTVLPETATVVDAGCGEGYYTDAVEKTGINAVIGIDISKEAVNTAAKRNGKLKLAVASTASIPLDDESADAVLNIFSPLFEKEFVRILKKDGYLLRVLPGVEHLMELKKAIYKEAYENPPPQTELEGFKEVENRKIKFEIELRDNESIKELFTMTPYYYKTGREDQMRLDALDELTVTAEFHAVLYKKKGEN